MKKILLFLILVLYPFLASAQPSSTFIMAVSDDDTTVYTTHMGFVGAEVTQGAGNKAIVTITPTVFSANNTVYGSGWNGVATEAPSQNAVYDKIETIIAGGGEATTVADTTTIDLTLAGSEVSGVVLGAGLTSIPAGNLTGTIVAARIGDLSYGTSINGTNITADTILNISIHNITWSKVENAPAFCLTETDPIWGAAKPNQDLNTTSTPVFVSINVTDNVYGAGWDGNHTAPTRNDIYDKIETLGGGHDAATITNSTYIEGYYTGQDLNATIPAAIANAWNQKGTSNLTEANINAFENLTNYYNKTTSDGRYIQFGGNGVNNVPAANITGLVAYVNESTTVSDTPTLDLTLAGSQISGVVLGAGLNGIPVANVTGALASTGTGSGLTALNGTNVTLGTVAKARGGTGAANFDNLIALTTNTSGNYVASVATTAPITGGAAGSEGAAITVALDVDGISGYNGSNMTLGTIPNARIDTHPFSLKNQTKSISVYNITASIDPLLWQTPKAITITRVSLNGVGGTNIVGRLEDCSATGLTCSRSVNHTDWTVTSGTESVFTTFQNATITAGNWTKWNTTSVSGAVTNFGFTIEYNEN